MLPMKNFLFQLSLSCGRVIGRLKENFKNLQMGVSLKSESELNFFSAKDKKRNFAKLERKFKIV